MPASIPITPLESAIPPHLQATERKCPMRMPTETYEPPFPANCARFPESTKDLVMAIVGVQYRGDNASTGGDGLEQILGFVKQGGDSKVLPKHFDIASVTDDSGAYNQCMIAYWNERATFEEWRLSSGFDGWWKGLDPKAAGNENRGWFLEIFFPSVDRYETIYSNQLEGKDIEGGGIMGKGVSGLIREHVYWGSMRDRLAISQTDELMGKKLDPAPSHETKDTTKERVRVPGKPNLAVIRSGQDWSQTLPEEHELYTTTMHPVLTEGMNFLARDTGKEIGCYSCRFMDLLDPKSHKDGTEQTFGLAYWDELKSLEDWSKEHQTHLNIFGGFMKYVKRLNFDITLHLYHEVLVLKEEQQWFEYVGCHEETGMLAGLGKRK